MYVSDKTYYLITYIKYTFHEKSQLFVPDPDWAPWIRILIDVKSWFRFRIRIETNTDPHHWCSGSKLGIEFGGLGIWNPDLDPTEVEK